MPSALTALDLPLAALGLYLLKQVLTPTRANPLPPGPSPLPILGNLLDWPSAREWETFTKWAELYGDIVHCDLMGQHVIILNDPELAFAMLERKGAIYSERPDMYMANKLVGWKDSLPLSPYNDRHKTMRTMFAKAIGTKSQLDAYLPMEEAEAQKFVRRIIDSPQNLIGHVQKLAASIILSVSHGYQVKEGEDPYVGMAEQLMHEFAKVTTPGAHLVDIIPAIDKLPSWFPGTGYRRLVVEYRKTRDRFLNIPHAFVKEQLATGVPRPSFVGGWLEKDLPPAQEHALKWAAAGMYGGGSDTTVSAILSFFLAMTLYPEEQAKAQAELDSLLGPDRLPNIHDRERLPYVDALVKEVLRWGCVAPQGVAHVVREDDVHQGYFIPKGSMIIPNLWKFTHDDRTYPAAFTFRPERFIATATHTPETDPKEVIFGFGRRICPGLHLADQSVWLTCATALATLSVKKTRDAAGNEITPDVEYIGSLITRPKPFACEILPRSKKAEALVRAVDDASA